MSWEALAIEGFNNGEERYESTFMDSFGTLMLSYTGSCENDGAVRRMKTQYADPMTGGTIDYRSEYRWDDNDHFTYHAFMDKGDGEFRNMLITFERQ